jgi:hypothetical protein
MAASYVAYDSLIWELETRDLSLLTITSCRRVVTIQKTAWNMGFDVPRNFVWLFWVGAKLNKLLNSRL